MALFQKLYCAECGTQTKPLFRAVLTDSQCVCSNCSSVIPIYMYKSFISDYSLDDFYDVQNYIRNSNETLRPIFKESAAFHSIHLDEKNHIFYLGSKPDNKTIFFRLINISEFDLVFKPEEYKEGLLGDKVKGDIYFELSMDVPRFHHEEKIVSNVKTAAKKKLFGSKVTFEEPPEMEAFLDVFRAAWLEDLEQNLGANDSATGTPSALSQAMALFMLDSLDGVTPEALKTHRNRLMKAFHPDKGNETDTRYAQKINEAYEVLKQHMES